MSNPKKYIVTASILGALAVMLGAMAAHGLEPLLEERALNAFKTASRYQMYHALAFLGLAVISKHLHERTMKWIYSLMLTGTILFCGSIYLLTTAPVMGMEFKFLGPITPLGGLLLITSWIFIGVAALKKKVD
jgi:uncharacterized membrane protein YgdD (TMEM256/DUF423 family)